MNRVDRIVDLIDNALDDYSASGDAMRWTPEPVEDTGSTWTWSYNVEATETISFDTSSWSDGGFVNLSWSEGITWNPSPPEVLAVTEADLRGNYDLPMPESGTGTIMGEDGLFHYDVIQRRSVCPVGGEWSSWLVIRPIPPAESVTIDLSVWD